MSEYHISVSYSDEDGHWVAQIPDLPGCYAYADTPEQAVVEVGHAKSAWIEAARSHGRGIPDPV